MRAGASNKQFSLAAVSHCIPSVIATGAAILDLSRELGRVLAGKRLGILSTATLLHKSNYPAA